MTTCSIKVLDIPVCPLLSIAWNFRLETPFTLVLPLITPVVGFKPRPVGKVPEETDQV